MSGHLCVAFPWRLATTMTAYVEFVESSPGRGDWHMPVAGPDEITIDPETLKVTYTEWTRAGKKRVTVQGTRFWPGEANCEH